MRKVHSSDAIYLLAFFASIISIGTALLMLPAAWIGTVAGTAAETIAEHPPLKLIDALFTATSAVCVTGLTSVDTAAYSRFGQIIILSLIQLGGLGIISFTSLLLIIPGRRLPFRRLKTIRSFAVGVVEHDPRRIMRNIIIFTLAIEAAGAAALYPLFASAGADAPLFAAVFHAVSAFCNAGFSTFSTNLVGYSNQPLVLAIVAALIVTGGIGFVVLLDIERRVRGKRKALSFHSVMVVSATAVLIVAGATVFWLMEGGNVFAGMGKLDRIMNALFQAITPRTAGFSAVSQSDLSVLSKFVTIILMFIGGAPGSTAGGVKVSTASIVLMIMLRRPDKLGDTAIGRRRITAETAATAMTFFLKAVLLLAIAVGALILSEGARGADMEHCVFEAVSAFGTVGLSLDFTTTLSFTGKLIIVATMFAGRVGLIALAFPGSEKQNGKAVYPAAEILLG